MIYGKYFQRVYSKWKPFEKAHYKYYPCPGCISHSQIIGNRRGKVLFEKYHKYPQKSHGLYWRTHPAEYEALLKLISKQ